MKSIPTISEGWTLSKGEVLIAKRDVNIKDLNFRKLAKTLAGKIFPDISTLYRNESFKKDQVLRIYADEKVYYDYCIYESSGCYRTMIPHPLTDYSHEDRTSYMSNVLSLMMHEGFIKIGSYKDDIPESNREKFEDINKFSRIAKVISSMGLPVYIGTNSNKEVYSIEKVKESVSIYNSKDWFYEFKLRDSKTHVQLDSQMLVMHGSELRDMNFFTIVDGKERVINGDLFDYEGYFGYTDYMTKQDVIDYYSR